MNAAARTNRVRPFLKWAGGKGQLLSEFEDLFPEFSPAARFFEPFVGSGAVFFHLRSSRRFAGAARLSDANPHLVTAWRVVRDEPTALAARLAELGGSHSEDEYYRQRERFNEEELDDVERAAVLVYLNKTGFNGLYRVNRRGKFNVPCGKQASGPSLPAAGHLNACSAALEGVSIDCAPFARVVEEASAGDFVYFDPPYVPLSKTSSFTDYSRDGFGAADQVRLRDVFAELDRKGCAVMLSNSDTPEARELYSAFDVRSASARRSINSKATARGPVGEIVVRNYS